MSTKQTLSEIRTRARITLLFTLLGSALAAGGYIYYWASQAAERHGGRVDAGRVIYGLRRIAQADTPLLAEMRTELATLAAAGGAVGGLAGLALIRLLNRRSEK